MLPLSLDLSDLFVDEVHFVRILLGREYIISVVSENNAMCKALLFTDRLLSHEILQQNVLRFHGICFKGYYSMLTRSF